MTEELDARDVVIAKLSVENQRLVNEIEKSRRIASALLELNNQAHDKLKELDSWGWL